MLRGSQKRFIGSGYMVMSAFFFSLIGVTVKLAGQEVGVWQINFYRALVGILLMLGLAGCFKVSLTGPDWKLLTIRGVSGALGFFTLTVALRRIPLAEVMVLFYLFPAFAAVFSPWINGERFPARDWLFIGLAFGGTLLVISPAGGIHPGLGHLCALITAMLAGLNTALVRRLSGQHSAHCIYFFFCLASVAVSFGPLALGPENLIPTYRGLLFLMVIGLFGTLGQLFMNQGFCHLPATEGGVVLMSQVMIAAAWGVLFFGEPLTWSLLGGGILIMAGGAGLSRAAGRRRTAECQAG